MFNIGFSELVLLAVLGLVVLGPEELPQLARKLAQLFNEFKRAKEEILSPVEDLRRDAHKVLYSVREKAEEAAKPKDVAKEKVLDPGERHDG